MYYLKMGLTKLKSADLVAKSMLIETKMGGNVHFPSPEPTIAAVTAKRGELEAWVAKSSGGDRIAIACRKEVYDELLAMLKKLAKYVAYLADKNEVIILSSGFEVRNPNKPLPLISRPKGLSVRRAERQGEVNLRWETVRGAMTYNLEITSTDPTDPNTEWIKNTTTTRITCTVDNLTPGTYYWFRAYAVGRKNTSGYSNIGNIMAA